MSELTKRATIYFDPKIHKSLKIKAAITSTSIFEFVDKAIRLTLAEYERDLAVFEEKANEPTISFEEVLRYLKANGRI
jgi:hypothetical protein